MTKQYHYIDTETSNIESELNKISRINGTIIDIHYYNLIFRKSKNRYPYVKIVYYTTN